MLPTPHISALTHIKKASINKFDINMLSSPLLSLFNVHSIGLIDQYSLSAVVTDLTRVFRHLSYMTYYSIFPLYR